MRQRRLKIQCLFTLFVFVFTILGVELALPPRLEAQSGGLDSGDIAVVRPADQPLPASGRSLTSGRDSKRNDSSGGENPLADFLRDPLLDKNVVVLKEDVFTQGRRPAAPVDASPDAPVAASPGAGVDSVIVNIPKSQSGSPAATARPAGQLEHWRNGDHLVVRDSAGHILHSEKVGVPVAGTEAATTATAGSRSSTWQRVKNWATTPVAGGGKGSAAWDKGYRVGNEAPTRAVQAVKNAAGTVVNKVKGVFHRSDPTPVSPVATPSTPSAPAPVSSTPAPTAASSAAPSVSSTPAGTPPPASTPQPKLEHWANGDRMVVRDARGRLVTHSRVDAATTPAPSGTAGTPAASTTSAPPAADATARSASSPAAAKTTGSAGRIRDAYRRGYDAGQKAPGQAADAIERGAGKLADKVKGVFRRDEAAPTEHTPAEAAAAATPAAPGRIREALGAGGSTLKSFFTPKTMLLSAGVTVGFKIVEQVRKGEKVDIGKAVGHLASGQFLGGYTGAALGASAGTVVGHLMKGIPVVGPVLGSFAPFLLGGIGGSLGASLGDDLSNGRRPSLKEAWAQMDKGQLVAQSIGGLAGFTLGNMLLPGIGGVVGSIVGGIVAGKVLDLIRGRKDAGNVAAITPGGAVLTEGKATTDSRSSGSVVQHGGGISGDSQDDYETMRAAYQRYSQLLAAGQGDSSEAREALQIYREAHARVQAGAGGK